MHGHLGPVQQAGNDVAVLRIHGHAHADAQIHLGLGQLQRAHQMSLPALDQGTDFFLGIQQRGHHKLVTVKAPCHAATAHQIPDTSGHLTQQRIPIGMAEGVIDILEPVQIQIQDGDVLAGLLCSVQQLRDLRLQQAAIGQTGQRVIVGQLLDPLARLFPLHGQSAQVSTRLHQLLMETGGHEGAVFLVIEGEGTQHLAVFLQDGRRPADLVAQRPYQRLEIGPQGIGLDIRHQHGLLAPGGGTTGAHRRADRHAIELGGIAERQTRAGQRMQQTLFIDLQNGGADLRRHPLHFLAHHLQHPHQRQIMGHGLQCPVVQHLVDLGLGDIQQYQHRVRPFPLGIHDRVADDLAPVTPTALARDHLFHLDGNAPAQIGTHTLEQLHGCLLRQQLQRLVVLDFAQGPAEHALTAAVAVNHPGIGIGDQDRRIGGVSHQRQAPQVILPGQLRALALGNVGGDHHDVGDNALLVPHRGIQGLEPAMIAITAHTLHHTGKLVTGTERLPHGIVLRGLDQSRRA